MYIKILDRLGANGLSYLTDYHRADVLGYYENLTFGALGPGGANSASFILPRPLTQSYSDLGHKNRVIIGSGPLIFWGGKIDDVARGQAPDTIEVTCIGFPALLEQVGTTADIYAPAGGYKASTFLTDVLLVDAKIDEITTGSIDTDDYAYPVGTKFEFAPRTTYSDALAQFLGANEYEYAVGRGLKVENADIAKLSWFPRDTSTVKWYVTTDDCTELEARSNPDALCTRLHLTYSPSGSTNITNVYEDTDAQGISGVIEKDLSIPGHSTPAMADIIGNLYIAECKDLKVSAEFTCSRIFDRYMVEHDLGEVEVGDNAKVLDWLPTEELLMNATISTSHIKSLEYDHDAYNLQVVPNEFVPQIEVMLARSEMVDYYGTY